MNGPFDKNQWSELSNQSSLSKSFDLLLDSSYYYAMIQSQSGTKIFTIQKAF